MREEDLSYFEDDEFKEALARYEAMTGGGTAAYLDADELTDIAEYYAIRGEEDKANQCIDYALRLHPGDADPLVFKARQQMLKGNLEEARRIRNTIANKQEREVFFLDAELLIRKEQVAEASNYLQQQAIHEEEDLGLYCYDCAGIFLDYNQYRFAREWAERMLTYSPNDTRAYLYIAESYIMEEDGEKAVPWLDKVLDADPFSSKGWNFMAEAYFMASLYDKGIEAADFALAIDAHDERAILMKANCHYQLGGYEEAHRLYAQYIDEQGPDEPSCLFDGISLSNMGQYEEALKQLKLAEGMTNYSPSDLEQLYLQLSFVRSKLGQVEEAHDALGEAIAAGGEDSTLEYDLLYGHILLENGNFEEAMEHFGRAALESTDALQTEYYIAVSLCENNRFKEALPYFRHVNQEDKTEIGVRCLSYLAYCYFYLEEYDLYIHYLKLAGKQDPVSTQHIFGNTYPGVQPEEYYAYAHKQLKGTFPKDM